MATLDEIGRLLRVRFTGYVGEIGQAAARGRPEAAPSWLPSRSSPACSAAASSKSSPALMARASSPSTATSPVSPIPASSRPPSPPPAARTGWSTRNALSGGPEQVFRYLSRYTHRIAISDSRITAFDGQTVSFRPRGSEGNQPVGEEDESRFGIPAVAGFMR